MACAARPYQGSFLRFGIGSTSPARTRRFDTSWRHEPSSEQEGMEKLYHWRLQRIANEICARANSPLIPFGFTCEYFGLPIALQGRKSSFRALLFISSVMQAACPVRNGYAMERPSLRTFELLAPRAEGVFVSAQLGWRGPILRHSKPTPLEVSS